METIKKKNEEQISKTDWRYDWRRRIEAEIERTTNTSKTAKPRIKKTIPLYVYDKGALSRDLVTQ